MSVSRITLPFIVASIMLVACGEPKSPEPSEATLSEAINSRLDGYNQEYNSDLRRFAKIELVSVKKHSCDHHPDSARDYYICTVSITTTSGGVRSTNNAVVDAIYSAEYGRLVLNIGGIAPPPEALMIIDTPESAIIEQPQTQTAIADKPTEAASTELNVGCKTTASGKTTLECLEEEYSNVDADLNKTYKKIILSLSLEDKSILKRSQIDWINEKEKKCGMGSSKEVVRDCEVEMTKQRLSYLKELN